MQSVSRNSPLAWAFVELTKLERHHMNVIIYLVGLVVVIVAILSFFGLR